MYVLLVIKLVLWFKQICIGFLLFYRIELMKLTSWQTYKIIFPINYLDFEKKFQYFLVLVKFWI